MSTSGGSGNPVVLAGERPSTVMQTTSRKNVINTSMKDASRFDRVKARNDKKKVITLGFYLNLHIFFVGLFCFEF